MTHEYQRQSLEQLITQQTATPRSAAVVFNENQTSGKHLALASLKFRYGLPHCLKVII